MKQSAVCTIKNNSDIETTKLSIAFFINPALTSTSLEGDILAGDAGLVIGIHTKPVLNSSCQPIQLSGGFMFQHLFFHRPITLEKKVRQTSMSPGQNNVPKTHEWKQPSHP